MPRAPRPPLRRPAYLVTAQQPAPPFAEMQPGRVRPAPYHTVQTGRDARQTSPHGTVSIPRPWPG